MGHKVNPNIYRLGVLHTWDSRWFSEKKSYYKKTLIEDIKLRSMLFTTLRNAAVARVEIERFIKRITIIIHVARPGVAIGRGGEELTKLKKRIEKFLEKEGGKTNVDIQIELVKKPDLDPYLVAQMISDQLVKRMPHKRIVSHAISRVMSAGAKGVRVVLSGRIAGAEIGRTEKYSEGTVPLSTIRENVRYAKVPAHTKSGCVGVKVWICTKSDKDTYIN